MGDGRLSELMLSSTHVVHITKCAPLLHYPVLPSTEPASTGRRQIVDGCGAHVQSMKENRASRGYWLASSPEVTEWAAQGGVPGDRARAAVQWLWRPLGGSWNVSYTCLKQKTRGQDSFRRIDSESSVADGEENLWEGQAGDVWSELSRSCGTRGDQAELRAPWKAEWTGHGDRLDVGARGLINDLEVSSLGTCVADNARNCTGEERRRSGVRRRQKMPSDDSMTIHCPHSHRELLSTVENKA